MQFIWPIKADYRILYVDSAYSQTIIGRIDRDYVWLMARTPQLPDADYRQFLELIARRLRYLKSPEGAATVVSRSRRTSSPVPNL